MPTSHLGNMITPKWAASPYLLSFSILRMVLLFPTPSKKPHKDGVRTKFSIGLSQLCSKSDGRTWICDDV